MNKQEDIDIYAAIKAMNIRDAALDGNDLMNEGVWKTSKDKTLTYFIWNQGQPDNWGGAEHCLTYQAGYMNDQPCTSIHNIVCVRPPTRE